MIQFIAGVCLLVLRNCLDWKNCFAEEKWHHEKGAGLNLPYRRYWYTLQTNKRAHARVVSLLLILLFALKITSFPIQDSKRKLLIFLLKK